MPGVEGATGGDAMAGRVEQIRSELGALVTEPVVAFGSFAQPGFVHSGVRRSGVPGTTWWHLLRSRPRRRRADTLPLQLYLVLTASRMFAVSIETSWRSTRSGFPVEVVRSWERADTTVEATAGPAGPEVVLTDADGETRLHSADSGGGFNDPILAALGA